MVLFNYRSEMTSQPTNNESETALVMIENGNVCETDHESSACNKNRRWSEDTKLRLLKFFEVLILISIMLVIIGLLLIPTAFYASPPQVRFCICTVLCQCGILICMC